MSSAVEIILLLAAIVVGAYAAVSLFRNRMRERTERDLLERLTAEAPTRVLAPSEAGTVEKRLRAAGLRGPSEAYVFTVSLVAVALSVLCLSMLPGLPLVALILFSFALYLPWTAVTEWAKRRARKFESLLIESIDLMAGALQSGANLGQAFRSAGSVAEDPVRAEFAEVDRRLALGMPLGRAFGRMIEGFDGEGVRLFTQTLTAKSQAGGDMIPVLRSLNETLRDRARQQRQVQAQLAGVRVSAIAISLLPYFFAPVLQLMRPDWFSTLFNHPLGSPLFILAVMLQLVGMVWIWRILSREL